MLKIDRVLLVGFGSIGKRHLNNLKVLLPNAARAVLRSRQDAAPIEGCVVVTSLEDAISFQPQAVFICTPSNSHVQVAVELAKFGMHLFIEKPLSNSVKGVIELMDVVRKANVKVMIGYNLRFSPSLIYFKERIESKDFGRPLFFSAQVGQYLPDWRPDTDYRTAVSSRSELGGGALLELSHELDYLSWLFGQAVSVSGQLLKISDLEIDVDDLVMAQICFERDEESLFGNVSLDFLQRKPSRSCKVVCERGTLVWDAIEDLVEVHDAQGVSIVYQGNKNRNFTYEQEILQFIDCIAHDKQVPVPIEDGYNTLMLIDALRESSLSKKVVFL